MWRYESFSFIQEYEETKVCLISRRLCVRLLRSAALHELTSAWRLKLSTRVQLLSTTWPLVVVTVLNHSSDKDEDDRNCEDAKWKAQFAVASADT
jgi:hypothetical protein